MGFDNYLSGLPAPGEAMIPGMGGLEAAMNQNRQMAPQQQPQQQPRGPHGLGHILGLIGATLAAARGRPAPYFEYAMQEKQRAQQQQANQAFANYLGDPELASLIAGGADAGAAMKAYGIKHPGAQDAPETIRLMQAAGIDPQSDEGRKIIQQRLQGGDGGAPGFVRELEAFGIDPRSQTGQELLFGKYSPSGFLLKPNGGGGQGAPSGGPPVGHVAGGYRFKGGNPNDRNSWEPVNGGPTPQASGPFPSAGH